MKTNGVRVAMGIVMQLITVVLLPLVLLPAAVEADVWRGDYISTTGINTSFLCWATGMVVAAVGLVTAAGVTGWLRRRTQQQSTRRQ